MGNNLSCMQPATISTPWSPGGSVLSTPCKSSPSTMWGGWLIGNADKSPRRRLILAAGSLLPELKVEQLNWMSLSTTRQYTAVKPMRLGKNHYNSEWLNHHQLVRPWFAYFHKNLHQLPNLLHARTPRGTRDVPHIAYGSGFGNGCGSVPWLWTYIMLIAWVPCCRGIL